MFNSTWESSFGAKELLQSVENQVLPEGMTLVPLYPDDEKGKTWVIGKANRLQLSLSLKDSP